MISTVCTVEERKSSRFWNGMSVSKWWLVRWTIYYWYFKHDIMFKSTNCFGELFRPRQERQRTAVWAHISGIQYLAHFFPVLWFKLHMGGGGCDRTLNSEVTFSCDLTQTSEEIWFRFCSVLPLPEHCVMETCCDAPCVLQGHVIAWVNINVPAACPRVCELWTHETNMRAWYENTTMFMNHEIALSLPVLYKPYCDLETTLNCADWWNLRYEGVELCVRLKALYVITTLDTKQSLLNHVMANVASFL